ncbi:valine--tRNA ligase [Sphingobium phenoxybenzoativorans]|uniref:Valine--tRNA ligase n=1 Tax=Sphingobium phenoxybenzoativorans TaxID=1592790 RepID=A0A975K751_9SPHN|nr:valine--tRNA ligase [Sphingobium phenoxybenzoativorans]QUT05313.1 valine--tRNA ligase [Sphingobium phenoxybenzoativorans]
MTELPKTFDPAEIENRWYAHWEQNGLFRPERPRAQPFTIVNPPPNVTGSLHIGHALDNTLQDIIVRYERLRGKDALWVVGTDHAGIATQMVVERQLNAQQQKRTDFTRDEFIAKVWEWKTESGGAITRQLRRLGCSMDWANERFTMDEGFSKAVIKVFVELHRRGLLYRDKRLVNWDPGLRTAISDLEVETREINGKFWHFSYPLEDGSGMISVATTRPETMLADMAVAVNPEDARYTALIGKKVRLPITGRLIPIVADEHADPELGSGAVKITPGHDFNDFEVGKRAGFKAADMLNMLDTDAKVVQVADGLIPDAYLGLDRFDARKQVVAAIEAAGLLEKVEDRVIQTPYGDRSGVVIEPWLTDQWYVDAETLAKPAIEAVKSGKIDVVPKTWEKTYFNWMENIQPWCVSRQLWWGHQIPAWYDEDGKAYVAEDEAGAQALAGNKPLVRDNDVLDTWFSSALWPFGTLGWPDDSPMVARHYPNDLLISGFDILFFWDARMAMQGLEFMGDVPWRKLYLHGLVRAADGQKMSKSKGNVVDPLGLIDQYGADALRFFMAAMESQGRDVKMDEKRVEGYRNFATKLWNAGRFLQSNGIGASSTLDAPSAELAVNRWIIAETVATAQAIELAFADLRFDAAANAIYHFVWDQFCDWYLELIKVQIEDETRSVAGWAFDQILVMLHPFMPFITEELWHAMGNRQADLIVSHWPQADAGSLDKAASEEIEWLIRLISAIRAARTELNIPPGAKMRAFVRDASEGSKARLGRQQAALARVARIESLSFGPVSEAGAAQIVAEEATFILPLEGVIDLAAEKARLTKAKEAAEKERDTLAGRLANASFVERAKPEAVAKAREDHAEKAAEVERLGVALARLG